jgi:hypothetical protein
VGSLIVSLSNSGAIGGAIVVANANGQLNLRIVFSSFSALFGKKNLVPVYILLRLVAPK